MEPQQYCYIRLASLIEWLRCFARKSFYGNASIYLHSGTTPMSWLVAFMGFIQECMRMRALREGYLSMSNMDLLRKQFHRYNLYIRASLASLLRCIKSLNIVEWPQFIGTLLAAFIFNDSTLEMARHFESLFVHLEMLSLVQVHTFFHWWHPRILHASFKSPFRAWQDMPPVVCMTMVVPRDAIAMFSNLRNETPIYEIRIQSSSSDMEAIYLDIQMGFGKLHIAGEAYSDRSHVTIVPGYAG